MIFRGQLTDYESLIVHALTKDNKFIRPTWFTSSFVHATNICEVTLRLDLHNLMYFNDKMGFILEFPFWLQGFKALKKVKVEIPICFESKPRHYKIMHMMTERLSAKLGVKGVMVDQLGPQYNLRAEVWVWEVAEGEKLMDWTQELGRAWRRLSREPREHWAGFFPWNLHAYKGELGMENGGFVIENWSTYYDRGWIYYR